MRGEKRTHKLKCNKMSERTQKHTENLELNFEKTQCTLHILSH